MQVDPLVRQIQARAEKAKLPMVDVAKEAGVNFTTWWRWSEGRNAPTLSTLRKIEAVLDKRGA